MIERYEATERRQVSHMGSSHTIASPSDEPPFDHGSRFGDLPIVLSVWAVACKMALNDESAAVARSSAAALRGSAARGQTWLPTNV
jgi:hypothetical protein